MTDRLRISVADDEADMREFFQFVLQRLGHDVVSMARNGRELLDHIQQLSPDLVISDIRMPEMDGLDVATEVSSVRPVPFIVISAYYDEDSVRRAEEAHIIAYLVKPIKESDLVPAISVAMKRFEEFCELRREADDLRQALEDRKIIEKGKKLPGGFIFSPGC